MANILVVGGFLTTALLYREVLQDEGHRVFLAMNGEEGVGFAQSERIDVVIVDEHLSDFEVSGILPRLKLHQPHMLGVLCVWDTFSRPADTNLWDGFFVKTRNFKVLQSEVGRLSQESSTSVAARVQQEQPQKTG